MQNAMRDLIVGATCILASLGPGALRAQEGLPAKEELAPRQMLYRYLLARAQKHFDARRAAIAALKTPADIQDRQRQLRARFVEALGGFPEKTPLNARTGGTQQRDGSRIARVTYGVRHPPPL